MRHRKRWKGRAQGASAQDDFETALLGLETGADQSRTYDARQDRKTAQLCRQVQRALMLALGGECDDPLLQSISVEAVEPMGSASHLLVRVGIADDSEASVGEILGRLNAASPRLRALVAQAISRKRVPVLAFEAAPIMLDEAGGGAA